MIKQRQTLSANIGGVLMGSDHPIVIQSMTNTPTRNIADTIAQIKELADAGSELVRITVNDMEAADAVPEIIKTLRKDGYKTPIIGDFHYNGHILLTKQKECARLLDKYRINPGNVGKGEKHDDNFAQMIQVAIDNNKPVRIGVNWGSLDQDLFTQMMAENAALSKPKSFKEVVINAMVESAISNTEMAIKLGQPKDKIIVSVKMSEIQDMLKAYQTLAAKTDYILHLGLTEAGANVKGIASSAAALAILLQQGIGNTIRVSLTPEPGVPRSREVEVCTNLLQTMDFRYFRPTVTSCPGCGRTDSDYFVHLAKDVNDHIDEMIQKWRVTYPGIEQLKIAVMGCVVNGPGESKYANIGISLPGIRETPTAPVYIDGKLHCTLKGDHITEEFMALLENYIKTRYGKAVTV
ncbi:flavodoxin-dependent (E)-4-hydroxy-3-methylbut-2-enyl-diphosphate synthase [bacterium]|jgi:(E)-4-hydroxy-3-methylbut-2-enyl-diphosphate synthase|nr:flavodoxin-dependent (E)-4-hydroxy-3-methylbut-2-enyl-diphosphate synthase [bacterium]